MTRNFDTSKITWKQEKSELIIEYSTLPPKGLCEVFWNCIPWHGFFLVPLWEHNNNNHERILVALGVSHSFQQAGNVAFDLSRQLKASRLVQDDHIPPAFLKIVEEPWEKREPVKNIDTFPLVTRLYGTAFQHTVWKALMEIPTGKTVSYKEMANTIHKPKASRATGHAIGRNPVCVLVPCHRVIASNGALAGYRWGKEIKTMLLEQEKESNAL